MISGLILIVLLYLSYGVLFVLSVQLGAAVCGILMETKSTKDYVLLVLMWPINAYSMYVSIQEDEEEDNFMFDFEPEDEKKDEDVR
jgi:hypothetical protein